MQVSLIPIQSKFQGKDILSLDQFDTASIEKVFALTRDLRDRLLKGELLDILRGTIATLVFFEPSSRTFSSFTAAVKRLGGDTISYQNPRETSSYTKGETLEDMARIFECYSDMLVVRHFEGGAPMRMADAVTIPVINAGDGSNEHPTQALFDMFTIHEKCGRLDNLTGVIAGDLLYGRTVHSLLKGLSLYAGSTMYLLAPDALQLPKEIEALCARHDTTLKRIASEDDIPSDAHFWYWTRVQKERFSDAGEYERLKNKFILTPELLKKKGNKDMIILHPLPRVGEIDTRIDTDPRALYLTTEVKNGLYVRMALVALVVGAV